jgi:hypothetical protein
VLKVKSAEKGNLEDLGVEFKIIIRLKVKKYEAVTWVRRLVSHTGGPALDPGLTHVGFVMYEGNSESKDTMARKNVESILF